MMLINVPNLPPVQLPAGQELRIQQALQPLEVGQLLKIAVLTPTVDNQLMLNIDGKNINARTSQQFFQGEVLNVKVAVEDGQTVLKIQDRQLPTELIAQALRQVLPRQNPPGMLIELFNSLYQLPKELQQHLPQDLLNQIARFVQSIPRAEQLMNPEGLKQALQLSGSFLESKLAQGQAAPTTDIAKDLKGQLLKIFDKVSQYIKQYTEAKAQSDNRNMTKAEQIAKFITRDLPNRANQLSQLQTTALEQAARLKNATSAKAPASQAQNPSASATNTTTHAKATHAHQGAEFLKHSALPIKGAVPQPIKTPPQTQLNIQNNLQIFENIKEHVNQSISRIQANQVSSIPVDSSPNPTFLIDVPIAIDDKTEVIPFLVEEENNPNAEDEEHSFWSIMLALDMENIGEVQVKVSLVNDKININIWSADEKTNQLLQQKEYLLEESLAEGDISVGQLSFHHGLKENDIDNSMINLLDLRI